MDDHVSIKGELSIFDDIGNLVFSNQNAVTYEGSDIITSVLSGTGIGITHMYLLVYTLIKPIVTVDRDVDSTWWHDSDNIDIDTDVIRVPVEFTSLSCSDTTKYKNNAVSFHCRLEAGEEYDGKHGVLTNFTAGNVALAALVSERDSNDWLADMVFSSINTDEFTRSATESFNLVWTLTFI